MFSVAQKRMIAEKIQQLLQGTEHPEVPKGEVQFLLRVQGLYPWSWAEIRNNGAISTPTVNPWNEQQDQKKESAT